ncbi:unnamed protein product [Fraxinus pennsylvanica]|uniref:Exonuclease V n=1 Tax=Fraxinus pennsylvanica TaxID=56036 RepID=A0AAD1ZVI7_9LAMI|nr:unnamed protein product [Fraxinus pennsylvanica]
MTESPAPPRPPTSSNATKIPQEIISEEEMALIDAAFVAAQLPRNPSCIQSITRTLLGGTAPDIEDSGRVDWSDWDSRPLKKRNRGIDSFLHRFRRERGLSVTDIIATEWCEKQMEFFLLFGKPEITNAMKVGRARHVELEQEVTKSEKVPVKSNEDIWAQKFLNFIVGANQLIFDGLTRELPVVGFVEGIWIIGKIDEIRLPLTDSERYATLVDTKTRVHPRLPSEPQRRNGRLQMMCYKYLWDSLVDDKFPAENLFNYFSVNPHYILSPEIRENTRKSGFASETLNDLVGYFRNSCRRLPRANNLLILRYESQEDQSLLGEDPFAYDSEWLTDQIKSSVEFWLNKREARYTPTEERWKCKFCKYTKVCTVNSTPDASSPS